MLGFNRWDLFKGLATILCILGTALFVLIHFIPAPPSKFAIATGARNQIYQSIGNRYREILARSNVDLEVRITNGPVDNIKLLNDPTSGVEAGIVQGGISDSIQSPELLSLGRINYNVYWIFYSATETLNDLRQLKGRRIALGPQGSLRATTEKILEISGVTAENTTLLGLSAQDAVNAVNDGQADALFFPFALDSAILHSLLINPRVRPMNFTQAEALTRIFPYLVRLVLPQGVIDFERMVPATDMILIAASNVVLVRKDFHPALINLLVQAIIAEHGKPGIFQQAGEFPKLPDPEYPMAESAVDFYKNGPSFLNKYLPYWIVPHVLRLLAVLLAGATVIYPLFNFAPKLYQWFLQDRMRKLYRRLRIVEEAAQTELTAPQVGSLQNELEEIDRAARMILPQRHSDLFFILEHHITLTRTQLASRLVEVRSRIAKVV
jgi:TRAP-type uncharacterized transport system substrate-binding protein